MSNLPQVTHAARVRGWTRRHQPRPPFLRGLLQGPVLSFQKRRLSNGENIYKSADVVALELEQRPVESGKKSL